MGDAMTIPTTGLLLTLLALVMVVFLVAWTMGLQFERSCWKQAAQVRAPVVLDGMEYTVTATPDWTDPRWTWSQSSKERRDRRWWFGWISDPEHHEHGRSLPQFLLALALAVLVLDQAARVDQIELRWGGLLLAIVLLAISLALLFGGIDWSVPEVNEPAPDTSRARSFEKNQYDQLGHRCKHREIRSIDPHTNGGHSMRCLDCGFEFSIASVDAKEFDHVLSEELSIRLDFHTLQTGDRLLVCADPLH